MSTRTLAAALALLVSSVGAQTELTTNGGFQTGSFAGWQLFPSQAGNITIGTGNGSTFGADVNNTVPASNSFLKHANLGIGQIMPGQAVMVSVDLKGVTAIGGLVFVQVFWELSGGGTSGAQLFGPLFADPNPATWTTHTFMTTAGPDVSGGVSIQLEAVTGGAMGSVASVSFDNVSITIPSAANYPGSGEDLTLSTGINTLPNGIDIKNAMGGDVLSVNVDSPGGTYAQANYLLVGQLVTTGSVGSVPGLPEVHINLALPFFTLIDPTIPSPIGSPIIGLGGGSTTYYQLPVSLGGLGLSLVLQAAVVSGTAANGLFAISDAFETVIL